MRRDPKTETVSTKLSTGLLQKLEVMAEIRGVSRSALLHEIVEAAASGRVLLDLPRTFESYSTRDGAPKVAANDRIQRRLVVQNMRQMAADARREAENARKATATVQESKARLRRRTWPEGFDLEKHWIDE